ncbi:hypothetical protein CDAR_436651 [Caerostris darwini]|uniref:Uncharacterized protein n=1 Tax=Caerostris darwini TaxID=1538125 RepID=A0AAV4SGM8_9ARAC|nr:hypothetical protein CDAR_436651 [Caerostris darwini]
MCAPLQFPDRTDTINQMLYYLNPLLVCYASLPEVIGGSGGLHVTKVKTLPKTLPPPKKSPRNLEVNIALVEESIQIGPTSNKPQETTRMHTLCCGLIIAIGQRGNKPPAEVIFLVPIKRNFTPTVAAALLGLGLIIQRKGPLD